MNEPKYSYEGLNSHRNARKQLGYGGAVEGRSKHRRTLKRLAKDGFQVKELTPYQYRINEALDVFITNDRFHNIKTGERGDFTSIKKLCKELFVPSP